MQRMKRSTRERLARHVRRFARRVAVGEMRADLGLSESEWDYLRDWVAKYGDTDPLTYPDAKFPADIVAELPPPWEEEQANILADKEEDHVERPSRLFFVGDTHAAPGQDFSRFEWLGGLVQERDPTHVIFFGDHWNLDGLCSHSSELEKEGMKFIYERDSGNEALQVFEDSLGDWRGEKVLLCGNHGQARLDRLEGMMPYLEGVFNLYGYAEQLGWDVIPFLQPYRVAGWRCQHYFRSPASSRPVGSIAGNARAVLERVIKYDESIAFGHTHSKDYWEHSSATGRTVRGINVGCFFKHHESYAGPDSNHRWWRGVIEVDNAKDGDGDVREWRMGTIERMFS